MGESRSPSGPGAEDEQAEFAGSSRRVRPSLFPERALPVGAEVGSREVAGSLDPSGHRTGGDAAPFQTRPWP